MTVVSEKVLLIFGVSQFILFHIDSMSIVERIKTSTYIEKLEVRNGFLSILTSDEDFENKVVECWKIDSFTGKI